MRRMSDIINSKIKKRCEHLHEKDPGDTSSAIISTTILAFIAILGIFGNILVLLVYCVKPKSSVAFTRTNRSGFTNNTEDSHETHQTSIQRIRITRNTNAIKSTQRYLILALASVDLVTCLAILPWDIFRTIYLEVVFDADSKDYFSWRHVLSDLLDGLRNIAFACEGTILAAIALDRFLTLVNTTPHITNSNDKLSFGERFRHKFCVFTSYISDEEEEIQSRSSSEAMYDPQFKKSSCKCSQCFTKSFRTSSFYVCSCKCIKIEKFDRKINSGDPFYQDCFCCGFLIPMGKSVHSLQKKLITKLFPLKYQTRLRLVFGLIIMISSTVAITETIIFTIHCLEVKDSTECGISEIIRRKTNQIYLIATLISVIFIAILYLKVFFTVRRQDIRNQTMKRRQFPKFAASLRRRERLKKESTKDIELKSDHIVESNNMNQLDLPLGRQPDTTDDPEKQKTPILQRRAYQINSMRQITNYWRQVSHNDRGFRSKRTGLMLFISTVLFYATLFPVLWVHFGIWSEHKYEEASEVESHTSGMHHEFYYINNAINVIIYSWLNPSFRSRLRGLRSVMASK